MDSEWFDWILSGLIGFRVTGILKAFLCGREELVITWLSFDGNEVYYGFDYAGIAKEQWTMSWSEYRYLSHALNAIQTACHNTHGAIICGWDYGPTVKIHDWTSWLIIANRNTGRPINQSDLELLMIRQGQCSSGGFN